jgi:putative ABC transport system permease protein
MLKVSLKTLWAYKRRLVGTCVAVVLGVAFLSGTLVLGDTLRANFNSLFAQANQGTDAVVRSASNVDTGAGQATAQRGLIDESLVDSVRSVDGVAAAAPSLQGYGLLTDKHGNGIGGAGPPTFAGNWITDPGLNPYHLVQGRAPRAADEVVINRGASTKGGLHLGDTTTVRTPQPVNVKIVGISKFGSADGLGGVTFTAFTLPSAQDQVTKQPGKIATIAIKGDPGVSQTDLVSRIDRALPHGVEAITGTQLVKENTTDINKTFLDLLTTFLLVFAGVALLVATFSIYNTFSILVAQRSRESALLRAVGALRRQVLAAVVAEALIIGVVASIAGLFGGVAIAGLLKGMFDAFGFALPAGGIVFKGSTVAIALVVGVVVTVVASLAPAVKASRVRPLAALRDVAIDRADASLARAIAGAALTVIGIGVVLVSVLSGGSGVLPRAGLGALLTFGGLVVFGPVAARAAGRVIGAPLPKLRGVTGTLAQENAMRNPRRTSGTAAALMVGVGVVTLFTVFAASLKTSIDDGVSSSFRSDLAVSAGGFGAGGFSPQLATDVSKLPEVQSAAGLGRGAAQVDGHSETLTIGNDTAVGRLLDLDVTKGSLAHLGNQQLGVSKQTADDKGWRVGTTLPVAFSDGTNETFTIGAIYKSTDIVRDYVMPRAAWDPHATQDVDSTALVKLEPGVSTSAGKRAVEGVAASFGRPDVLDRSGYVDQLSGGVNIMLGMIYVMLALAILIALMGIANTLSLSIHERTRELGLLRAVGQTRRQLRSMIRWESVVVAVFGTVGGVGVGIFLGWALVEAASKAAGGTFFSASAFSAPVGQLAVVLVIGAVAGMLAGLRPARRAAKLPILLAVAAE